MHAGNEALKFIVIASSVALLTACGAGPVATSVAKSVPSARIMASAETVPGPGKQEVIVKRDKGIDGAFGIDARFYLNGKHVANIANGEVLLLYLSPGTYRFGVQSRGGDRSGEAILDVSSDIEQSTWSQTFRIRWVGSGFKAERYTGFIIRSNPV